MSNNRRSLLRAAASSTDPESAAVRLINVYDVGPFRSAAKAVTHWSSLKKLNQPNRVPLQGSNYFSKFNIWKEEELVTY